MTRSLLVMLLATGLSGCISLPKAPLDYQRSALPTTSDARGSWVLLDLMNGERHQGELLAIGPDSLFVAGYQRFESFGRSDLKTLRVEAWNSDWKPLTAWTIAGTLSAFSHGLFVGLSGTAWLTTFGVVATTSSGAGHTTIRENVVQRGVAERWRTATAFARFPAGLPDGVDRSMLRLVRANGETIVVRL